MCNVSLYISSLFSPRARNCVRGTIRLSAGLNPGSIIQPKDAKWQPHQNQIKRQKKRRANCD